jgi:hypothetical protein
MFPPPSDGACAWIVRSERKLRAQFHMLCKSVWSGFPTPSTKSARRPTERRVGVWKKEHRRARLSCA